MASELRLCAKRSPRHVKHLEVDDAFRIGRRQRSNTLGGWRIDPRGVYFVLGLLRLRADHLDLAVPAAREDRAGRSEVETGDICLLVIWLGRLTQQFGGSIVPRKGAHPRGVLA